MANNLEKGGGFNSEQSFNAEQLAEDAERQNELISEDLERRNERDRKSPEKLEEIRREAFERAKESAKDNQQEKVVERSNNERFNGPISRRDRDLSFHKTMSEVQSQLSPLEKGFSKIIHNQAIERASDFTGKTAARPNAILAGSISAFLITIVVLLVARHYGYMLSGFESLGAFIIGWILGLIYDLLRVLFTGKTD